MYFYCSRNLEREAKAAVKKKIYYPKKRASNEVRSLYALKTLNGRTDNQLIGLYFLLFYRLSKIGKIRLYLQLNEFFYFKEA